MSVFALCHPMDAGLTCTCSLVAIFARCTLWRTVSCYIVLTESSCLLQLELMLMCGESNRSSEVTGQTTQWAESCDKALQSWGEMQTWMVIICELVIKCDLSHLTHSHVINHSNEEMNYSNFKWSGVLSTFCQQNHFQQMFEDFTNFYCI